MSQHDRYENDILKQLTRMANALEGINEKLPTIFPKTFIPLEIEKEDNPIKIGDPIVEGRKSKWF